MREQIDLWNPTVARVLASAVHVNRIDEVGHLLVNTRYFFAMALWGLLALTAD
jgi:hypothetical protein